MSSLENPEFHESEVSLKIEGPVGVVQRFERPGVVIEYEYLKTEFPEVKLPLVVFIPSLGNNRTSFYSFFYIWQKDCIL